MSSKSLRIAVVGAGPAGCTLANLLNTSLDTHAAVSVTIFEREPHLHDRDQGGTLDLHEETGLAAIRACGLANSPEFAAIARHDGDSIILSDKKMTRWIDLNSSADGGWFSQGKPEVDRLALRRLLIQNLPADTIRWNKHVVKIQAEPDSTWSLAFTDGSNATDFDLVVGADGTYSVVRPLLTLQQPFYSGVGGWNMLCYNAEATRPLLTKLVRRGSLFAFSDGKVLMGQQLGSGDLYISMWGVKPTDWQDASGYDVRDPKAVKSALLHEFRNWAPELRELISCFDESKVWPRDLVMLPTGIDWNTRPGVTLLGDAAHVMCPFVGAGVNEAMADAMDLSKTILTLVQSGWTKQSLAEGIQNYEQQMLSRVHKSQRLTEDIMKLVLFTPGAPETIIEKYVVRNTAQDMNYVVVSLWQILVTLYYFIFRLVVRGSL